MTRSETVPIPVRRSAAPRSAAGTELGKYTLDRELASGGMGVVYLARVFGPSGFEKRVALKRIHPHLANHPDFVRMLLEEARIASRIVHPNVCGVLDVGVHDGAHYLVMDYLEGRTLAQLVEGMARRREPEPDLPLIVARIGVDVAEGLHAAHSLCAPDGAPATVIHRDVSPQNIHIGTDGAVRVMDFGVAHALDRVRQTEPGTVKGKLAYLAPEALRDRAIDPRADLWALGVCLWEMLACARLFHRDSPGATVVAVLEQEIPAARSPVCAVPEALRRIVAKALERDPDRRYASARELSSDLQQFLADERRVASMADVAAWALRVERDGRESPSAHPATEIDVVERAPVDEPSDGEGPTQPLSPPAPRVIAATRSAWAARALWLSAALVVLVAVALWTTGEAPIAAGAGAGSTTPRAAEPIAAEPIAAEPIAAEPSTEPVDPIAEAVHATADEAGPTDALALTAPEAGSLEAGSLEADAPAHDHATSRARRGRARRARASATASDSARATSVGEARASSAEPGTIDVSTPGAWSEIRLDGAPRGRTPQRLTVSAGTHVIELQRFGTGARTAHRVTVAAGARERLVVREPP